MQLNEKYNDLRPKDKKTDLDKQFAQVTCLFNGV